MAIEFDNATFDLPKSTGNLIKVIGVGGGGGGQPRACGDLSAWSRRLLSPESWAAARRRGEGERGKAQAEMSSPPMVKNAMWW